MSDTKWSTPVLVSSPFLGEVAVTGPFHAITLLMNCWPSMSGPHFIKARIACSAAMQGRVSPDEARAAFVLAVEEAGAAMRKMQAVPVAASVKLQ